MHYELAINLIIHLYVVILPTPYPQVIYNFLFIILFFNKFIYLFLAVLGLHFCVRAFSSCGKWGPLFIAVRGLLTIAASLVADHRLQTCRLSSCGSRAQWHVGSSQTRGRTRVPCIGRQILNHCAPGKTFIILLNFFFSLSFSNLNML